MSGDLIASVCADGGTVHPENISRTVVGIEACRSKGDATDGHPVEIAVVGTTLRWSDWCYQYGLAL